MPSKELVSEADLKSCGDDLIVLNFWAEWCKPCTQLNQIFDQLADSYQGPIHFFKVEAEKLESVTEKYGITAVPTFIFIKNQTQFDKVEGANAPELANKVDKYAQVKSSVEKKESTVDPKQQLHARLEKLINFAPVMLFMKGTPSAPQCGFSNKIVEILNKEGIKFHSFNILSDEEVRQGLKDYSNWPTFPQLYANGKLIGGLDIVKEMADEGELKSIIPVQKDLNARLTELVNKAPVMLFMKGTPEAPQCGFSRKIVDILNNQNVQFSSFNILADEEVRQGLKTLFNWPTYPQLYSKGKLIGGLDIVKELADDGELLESLK